MPVTAPLAHSGFTKGSFGLYVIIIIIKIKITMRTPFCDKNHSLTIKSQDVEVARWDNRGSRFESGWATIDFFFSSYKNFLLTFQSSFQALHQSFRVQCFPPLRPPGRHVIATVHDNTTRQ